jgi:NAD-dependent DNA ligase
MEQKSSPKYTIGIKKKNAIKKTVKKRSPLLSDKGRLNEKFIEVLDKLSGLLLKQGEPFRARAYQKAQETIMVISEDITAENYRGILSDKPGIGVTIMQKFQEYVETGTLELLERERTNPVNIFTDVYGIGPKRAKELVAEGVTSIEDLRKKQDDLLNDVQQVGLKYYEDILERIPRSEIDEFRQVFTEVFQEVITDYSGEKPAFEIVGSYRRGASSSGDIDVIITGTSNAGFRRFIEMLEGTGLILEILSRGSLKCLVVGKLDGKSRKARRIDFLYTSPREYPFAVLYFTGSKIFNTVMRARALTMGYTLNEHGIYHMEAGKKKGALVTQHFQDERSIFDFLKLKYKSPEERIDGRSVIASNNTPVVADNIAFVQESEVSQKTTAEILDPVISPARKTKKKSPKLKIVSEFEPKLNLAETKDIKPKSHTIKMQSASNKSSPKTRKNSCPPCNESLTNSVVQDNPTVHAIQHFKSGGISVLSSLSEDALSAMVVYANENYYNLEPGSSVLLTDNEYDVLKEFIERKFPKNTVIHEVGAPIEKNKVTLPYQMPSMDKIKPDSGALESWCKKYKGSYVLSCKLDGVSGMYSLEGDKPKLYTRGNGTIGQDVTHLITPLRLPKGGGEKLVVRGEFIMPKKVFTDKYQTQFANARNLVAGIVNRQSVDDKTRDLHFVAYEVIKPVLKPSEQMEFLKAQGFEVVQNRLETAISNAKLSETLVDWRANYAYEIDGVIVTNDAVYPRASGNPDHAFAFKMVLSDQMAEAKVVNVIWNASKDGLLKPRVQIEPLRLGGVTIEFATGFNASFIETNKIGVGAVIQLIRSGDVIPYIKEVVVPAETPLMPDVPYRWNDTHVDIILENAEDDATVREKNITGFFKGIEVDGLGAGNITKIITAGFDSIPKIIKMSKADLLTVDGFKDKMATKVFDGIRQRLDQASLGTIMSASNIFGRGFGDRKIKLVLDEVGPVILTSGESVGDKTKRIAGIKGMASKTASAFVEQIPTFLAFLEECGLQGKLLNNTAVPEPVSIVAAASHPLYKKSIVMSGSRDKALEQKLKDIGATLGSSVSKNTFAVITPDVDSETGKVSDAKKHGVPVYTPAEFSKKYL